MSEGIIISDGNTFEFPSDEVTGQLVIPSIGGLEFRSPTKKRPNYQLEITAVFPPESVAHHTNGDVRWIMLEPHGGRLKNCWIILEFEQDTLRATPTPEVQTPAESER